MRTVTIDKERNNFHNVVPIRIRIDPVKGIYYGGSDLIEISVNQARRLDHHFCGIRDCQCGSSPVVEMVDRGRFFISAAWLD